MRSRMTLGVSVALALAVFISTSAAAGDRDSRTDGRSRDSAFEDAVTHVKVRTELLTKLGWDALHIDVSVHGPDVLLSGTVKKRSTQELAEEVALAVSGVNHVTDDVRLQPGPTQEGAVKGTVAHAERELRDALLEARVKGRLLEEIGREGVRVEVEATDGVVSLRGTVPTAEQREVAVRTATRTKGVVKVIDLIREPS